MPFDFLAILITILSVLGLLALIFIALMCITIFVSALTHEDDHEHFDYEDFYPEKTEKHHK